MVQFTYMYVGLAAILGAIIGSFLNVVALRVPQRKTLSGRSQCPVCGALIRWYENIPLVSFLVLRGQCRSCKKAISWQYPLVETAMAVMFAAGAAIYITHGEWLKFLTFAVIVSYAIVLFVTDVKFGVLPDSLTLSGASAVLMLNILSGSSWTSLLLAAAFGGLFFQAQRFVSRGRWVGDGDVRMGIWMGASLGWPQVLIALFLSYIAGALVGGGLLIGSKAKWDSQVPFGTFLALATVVTFVWGTNITNAYLRFIGF